MARKNAGIIVVTRTGRHRYASEVNKHKRKSEAVKSDRGSFWADYEPRRDLGTFAHEPSSFKMNGATIHR